MTREERTRWLAVGILRGVHRVVTEQSGLNPPIDTVLCAEALMLVARGLLDEVMKPQARPPALH